jgi:hypothetical protein
MAAKDPLPKPAITTEAFVALEAWIEECEKRAVLRPSHDKAWGAACVKVHTARQRAFELLTGTKAPAPLPIEREDQGVDAKGKKPASKSDAATDEDDIA